MKPEKLNVEPAEKPLTRLQSAIAGYDAAVSELTEHRTAMGALRSRINDLGAAIKDLKARTAKQPSMASLSIDQIRALSASKAAEYAEVAGLNAAMDVAEAELKSMEGDERGIRLLIQDTKTGAWAALYEQLKASLDPALVAKLVTAGFMAGMSRWALCDDLLGEDSLDAGLAESLAQQFGMPL